MKWRWMITKWVWDVVTKLGQYPRYQSKGNPWEYRLWKKLKKKMMSLELLGKESYIERTETDELQLSWDEGKWWESWRRSGGKVFHKAGAEW